MPDSCASAVNSSRSGRELSHLREDGPRDRRSRLWKEARPRDRIDGIIAHEEGETGIGEIMSETATLDIESEILEQVIESDTGMPAVAAAGLLSISVECRRGCSYERTDGDRPRHLRKQPRADRRRKLGFIRP